MQNIRTYLTVATFGLFLFSCKQSEKQDETVVVENRFSTLETKIKNWQNELHIPNVGLGIIEDGEIVYGKVLDHKDTMVIQDMQFNIASITKVIFGTTVMQLVDRGEWDLDDPLFHYHIDDDVKDDPRHRTITARDVLSQRSGFVNWRWNHPTGKLTFDFDPGTTFNYSGEGMEYLRQAIEKKYNRTIDAIADSLLFQPASMRDTHHSWDGKKDFEKFSRFYDSSGQEHELDDYSFTGQAADDIMTTVEDLTRFGQYVLNGSGIKTSSYAAMVTAQTKINDNQDQALAWRLIQNLPNQEYAIHHGGNDIGVATLLVLLPKSNRGIIVMTNSDSGLVLCNNIVREVWKEGTEIIHRAYRSGLIDDIPVPINVAKEILDKYQGVYEQPSGRKVNITSTESNLIMQMAGVPNFQLYPKSETEFFLKDFDPIIAFEKADNNNFILKIIEGENIIECKKIDNE